ncbi:MAG: Sporulation protein [Gemmatimonadetes bacterium]|nr:Sporulation protein [Gemmatimonadota bacterium]
MSPTRTMDWTEEGRRVGVTLDAFHAVVVAGIDPVATAQVALGIARVQAVHRRVALGDLLGEAEPLQSLLTGDDPHGLVDSFLYGVSLTKIAQRVPDAGELFIMPTGTGPVDYDELFSNPRWRRLISGFREVGALLIIAAPADAPRVHELVDATDGVVIVGDAVPADVSVAQSLAWVRPRRGAPSTIAGTGQTETTPPLSDEEPLPAPAARSSSRKVVASVAGVAIAVAIAALIFWFAQRPFASSPKPRTGVNADSPSAQALTRGALVAESISRARRDSVARDSLTRAASGGGAADSFPMLAPANPADSASASAFAILLAKYNTKSGVILDLNARFDAVPAATYGVEAPTRFFLLVAGAYPARSGADSLLLQLRARKKLAQGFGSVASFPLAFLVDSAVKSTEVRSRLTRYAARGLPVYALRQPNGTARLYYGAYASAEQAAFAVPSVREAGMIPTLVYRMGRVF